MQAVVPAASVDGIAYDELALEFLHAEGPKDLEKAGGRRAVRAAPGSLVVVTLPLPAPGTMVRAVARGLAGRERGQKTLVQAVVVQAPVEAPRDLTASLVEDGVALSWLGLRPKEPPPPPAPATGSVPALSATLPPAEGPPPPPAAAAQGALPSAAAAPRRSGFFVYRRLGGEAYGAPLNAEPLPQRNHKDASVPPGQTACYVVRAVAVTDPLVESAPSAEACLGVRDVAAPATPSGLAALPREGGIEILWEPGTEPDLAGYRVYRTGPGGAVERLAEVGMDRSAWTDETAGPGVAYRYAVTAFDRAGNESTPAGPIESTRP
jgi:hypothetical protein